MDDIREGGAALHASNRKAYELSVLNSSFPDTSKTRCFLFRGCLRMQSSDSHMLRFSESPTNTNLFPLNALHLLPLQPKGIW